MCPVPPPKVPNSPPAEPQPVLGETPLTFCLRVCYTGRGKGVIPANNPLTPHKTMSKNIYLPPCFKIVAVALLTFAMLYADSIVLGQNPVTGRQAVQFIRNGVEHEATVDVPGVWVASGQPWNGKFTKNGPSAIHPASGQMEKPRITNINTSLTFFDDPNHKCVDPNNPNYQCDPSDPAKPCCIKFITAAEVNAYWDARYVGATRIGGPTWSENCHGHSTGLGYWINDFGVVCQYDWVQCTNGNEVTAGCLRGDAGHSIKISGVQLADENYVRVVSETTEKMGEAGTYKYTYFLPGGAPLYPASTYRRK